MTNPASTGRSSTTLHCENRENGVLIPKGLESKKTRHDPLPPPGFGKDDLSLALKKLMTCQKCEDLEAEIQRLRAAIEKAPHSHLCAIHYAYPCDCWKRDALRSPE